MIYYCIRVIGRIVGIKGDTLMAADISLAKADTDYRYNKCIPAR